jgi:hypothetical protein
MAEIPDPGTSPEDPAEAVNVYITIQHVVDTDAGIFSVSVFDPMGRLMVDAPLVPDATDWAEALAIFWANVGPEVKKVNAAPNN